MTIPKVSQKKNIFCQNINFGKYILTFICAKINLDST